MTRPASAPSLPARLLVAGVRLYQAFLSPLMPSACKFHPSCSRYAAEAVERWGARQGAWLALKRLLRCRPFSPGGYDPVPDELPGRGRTHRRAAAEPGGEAAL